MIASSIAVSPIFAQDDPKAVALLDGALESRKAYQSFVAEYSVAYLEKPGKPLISVRSEHSGEKWRVELLDRPSFDFLSADIVVDNGAEIIDFLHATHSDVYVSDEDRLGVFGADMYFDPRLIGVTVLGTSNAPIEQLFWQGLRDETTLVGEETYGGADVSHVRCKYGSLVSDFWIEEPTFRIHRRTTRDGDIVMVMQSTFVDGSSPFPASVDASYEKDGNVIFKREFTVSKFEATNKIRDDRFEMATMDIPIGTPIIDLRTQRRIGFWNGDESEEHPVSDSARPTPKTWIWLNVVLIAVILAFMLWRQGGWLTKHKE